MLSRRSSAMRHPHLPQLARPPRPVPLSSSSRATCIVRVDPPDTTRPFQSACAKARAMARGSTPAWLVEPLVFIGQQHGDVSRDPPHRGPAPCASAHRPRYRRAARCRSGPPPRPRFPRPRAGSTVSATQRSTRSRAMAAAQRATAIVIVSLPRRRLRDQRGASLGYGDLPRIGSGAVSRADTYLRPRLPGDGNCPAIRPAPYRPA